MLYLPKINTETGTKGIRLGNIFIPLSGEAPIPGQKGLYIRSGENKFFLPLNENEDSMSAGQKGIFFRAANKKIFIPIIADPSLVFYAPLTEDVTRAVTGQTLTKSGIVSYTTVDGIPCAHFESGAYIAVPELSVDMSQPFTMAMYAKFPLPSENKSVIGIWLGSDDSHWQAMGVNTWGSNDFSYTGRNGGTNWDSCNTEKMIGSYAAEWVHLAIVFDGSVMHLYLNGTETGTWSTRLPVNANGYLVIGNENYNLSDPSSKDIAGVRIYNRALSQPEIAELSQKHAPTT